MKFLNHGHLFAFQPITLFDHFRNISDEQIKACAKTGGVIGINGVGDFLGGIESELVVRNIEYVADLVGPEYVGLGLDYAADQIWLRKYVESMSDVFPSEKIINLKFVVAEQVPVFTEILCRRGCSEQVIGDILGGNFLRVASRVWK